MPPVKPKFYTQLLINYKNINLLQHFTRNVFWDWTIHFFFSRLYIYIIILFYKLHESSM